MGSEGAERNHTEARVALLEANPPPAAEDDGSPSLWSLLQAARHEPLLGSMYPWISMQQLSVSGSDSWEEWGHQPLPAMFARPDSYAVVGRSKLGDRIAFKTADPAEAAAFAARLVRDRPAAAQLKAVQVWSAEAEAVLRDAGWHPGRSIDTAPWRARRKRTASGSTPPPRNCYASSAG